jgi:hypothetical protein
VQPAPFLLIVFAAGPCFARRLRHAWLVCMFTAEFAHFKQPARIFTREDETMTFSEKVMVRLILADAAGIIRRCRRKLEAEDPTLAQDNPFEPHARVELYLDEFSLFLGFWHLEVYWDTDEENWAGMHIYCRCFYLWPTTVDPVY